MLASDMHKKCNFFPRKTNEACWVRVIVECSSCGRRADMRSSLLVLFIFSSSSHLICFSAFRNATRDSKQKRKTREKTFPPSKFLFLFMGFFIRLLSPWLLFINVIGPYCEFRFKMHSLAYEHVTCCEKERKNSPQAVCAGEERKNRAFRLNRTSPWTPFCRF